MVKVCTAATIQSASMPVRCMEVLHSLIRYVAIAVALIIAAAANGTKMYSRE